MISTADIKMTHPQDAVRLLEAAQHESLAAIADFYVFAFGVTPPKYHALAPSSKASTPPAWTFSPTDVDVGLFSTQPLGSTWTPPQQPPTTLCACGCLDAPPVDVSAWTWRADELGHPIAHTPQGVFRVSMPDRPRMHTPLEHQHVAQLETTVLTIIRRLGDALIGVIERSSLGMSPTVRSGELCRDDNRVKRLEERLKACEARGRERVEFATMAFETISRENETLEQSNKQLRQQLKQRDDELMELQNEMQQLRRALTAANSSSGTNAIANTNASASATRSQSSGSRRRVAAVAPASRQTIHAAVVRSQPKPRPREIIGRNISSSSDNSKHSGHRANTRQSTTTPTSPQTQRVDASTVTHTTTRDPNKATQRRRATTSAIASSTAQPTRASSPVRATDRSPATSPKSRPRDGPSTCVECKRYGWNCLEHQSRSPSRSFSKSPRRSNPIKKSRTTTETAHQPIGYLGRSTIPMAELVRGGPLIFG